MIGTGGPCDRGSGSGPGRPAFRTIALVLGAVACLQLSCASSGQQLVRTHTIDIDRITVGCYYTRFNSRYFPLRSRSILQQTADDEFIRALHQNFKNVVTQGMVNNIMALNFADTTVAFSSGGVRVYNTRNVLGSREIKRLLNDLDSGYLSILLIPIMADRNNLVVAALINAKDSLSFNRVDFSQSINLSGCKWAQGDKFESPICYRKAFNETISYFFIQLRNWLMEYKGY